MERIAIIDLGSNSIRFVIMQIGAHGSYKLIYQEKKSIRLAEGMTLDSRQLTEEAQQRALQCLTVYAHIMAVQKVKKILAVATAAVRNAVNGASFLKRVHLNTGIPMTIISGKAEAALGFSGVAHTIDRRDFLLFDLGGASVEISLVKNKKRVHSISIPLGAVTLTEM
ncbi:Ppx/GppA phosphatase family protein, partial [Dialister succinatiphilus]|uniref:Ppx/GppA phosphatase family protein n=1 Tax=Dialister succinatiphilus TaxID=487173 RepID=UPI003C6CCEDA